MNKYGQTAIKAVEMYAEENISVIKAWSNASDIIFNTAASKDKGCPRSAFLGLCEEGLIKGIPRGEYTKSIINKDYSVRAAGILKEKPECANKLIELWYLVTDDAKTHNSQMDVVIALFNNGMLN